VYKESHLPGWTSSNLCLWWADWLFCFPIASIEDDLNQWHPGKLTCWTQSHGAGCFKWFSSSIVWFLGEPASNFQAESSFSSRKNSRNCANRITRPQGALSQRLLLVAINKIVTAKSNMTSVDGSVLNKTSGRRLMNLMKLLVGAFVHIWIPGEPKTFIFGGYDPYIEGLKTFIFHGFGVQRFILTNYIIGLWSFHRKPTGYSCSFPI